MRCFIAITFEEEIIQEIKAFQYQLEERIGHLAEIRTTSDYHITLSFLGEIENESVKIIKNTLSSMNAKSLTLSPKQIITFPNQYTPRILSLGFQDNKDYQKLIQTQLLIKTGIISQIKKINNQKHTFIPHITLFRIKKIAKGKEKELLTLLKSIRIPRIKFKAKTITFFESTITPEGPIYDTIISQAFED